MTTSQILVTEAVGGLSGVLGHAVFSSCCYFRSLNVCSTRGGFITLLCSQVTDSSLILSGVVYFLLSVAMLNLGDLTAVKKDLKKSP